MSASYIIDDEEARSRCDGDNQECISRNNYPTFRSPLLAPFGTRFTRINEGLKKEVKLIYSSAT